MSTPATDQRPRSAADRLVRQLLLIENAAPRSIMSLKGSLVITAVRCILMYAVIPLLVPVIGWLGVVARPISIAMSVAAAVLALYSLRRVWLADWHHRWWYTAFIGLVLTLLGFVIALDIRALTS